MNDHLPKLLLRRSEISAGSVVWGVDAAPYFGRAFNRLLSDGVLTERAPAATWAPCGLCDGGCGERDILEVGGTLVAECPEYPEMRHPLAAHEIRSFAIDVPALVAAIARGTKLTDGCEPVAAGVWMLGRIGGGRSVVLALDRAGLRLPDGLALIRARVDLTDTTLLVPDTVLPQVLRPYRDAGCHVCYTELAIIGDELLLDPAALVPKEARATRLLINNSARTINLDGRPLALTDQTYSLMLALAVTARQHDGFLERNELLAAVYKVLQLPASRPLRDIVRDLRERMAAGLPRERSVAIRALIENRRGEKYRLMLSPSEIDITG